MARYINPPSPIRGVLLLELALSMLIISVALLGLMEGYRASTEANARYDRMADLQLLADQKIAELSQQAQFKTGQDEAVFQTKPDVSWQTVTAETAAPNLYMINLEVSKQSDNFRISLFMRPKKAQ
ncbi:hypothetical protein LLG95_16710 [bacterium]|nr:hypothetical protein [bacterium]